MILTTYFTEHRDPQRNSRVIPDDPNRLMLLAGARKLGMDVVVFHDHLSPAFCKDHTTDTIRFRQVVPHLNLSPNDYRFFVFRDWLAYHPECKIVWCSDLFDVAVNQDPDTFFRTKVAPDKHLAVGIHNDWCIDKQTKDGAFLRNLLEYCYDAVPTCCEDKPILMAGSWGGWYQHVLRTLILLTSEIGRLTPRRHNVNLPVFQHVIARDVRHENCWVGVEPFVSRFRAFDTSGKTVFAHK